MRLRTYIISGLAALLSACGDVENEYTASRCYLTLDNTAGRSIKLAEAMNPLSPGVFCRIKTGGKYYFFETNASPGNQEKVVFTAVEERRTLVLGVYNESGIIIGYGNLNSPATFYAYDSQCPNCYNESNLPRYTLSMDTSGKAKCGSCGRMYDLNNGGIVTSGEQGSKLIRYRASTTGPYGVLSVGN